MKLGYVIIYVKSVEETVAFYERAFAQTRRFVHESGQYAELETGATALAFADESMGPAGKVAPNRASSAQAPGAEIGLVTKDVEAAFAKAIAAGATPVSPPTTKPWGQTVSYVRDNNGFLVEICSPIA